MAPEQRVPVDPRAVELVDRLRDLLLMLGDDAPPELRREAEVILTRAAQSKVKLDELEALLERWSARH